MTRFLASLAIALCLCGASTQAMPAKPRLRTFQQPDGATFQGYVRGDEHRHWLETADGHPIARGNDGFLYYVSRYSGERPVLDTQRADQAARQAGTDSPPYPDGDDDPGPFDDGTLHSGPLDTKVLFILVEYGDQPAKFTNPKLWANKLYDQDAPSNRSVVDYYLEASQGVAQLSPAEESHKKANNGVIGWLNVGATHPDPGQFTPPGSPEPSNSQPEASALYAIFKAAIAGADPFIDYGDFDVDGDGFVVPQELAIVVVVSGFDQAVSDSSLTPSVWPRATAGAPIAEDGATLSGEFVIMAEIQEESGSEYSSTIGTPVHELGHLIFGLPDLYDRDHDSDGVGPYSVMGTGCYGEESAVDAHGGETPVLPDAWTLHKLGWAEADGALHVQLHSTGSPLANGVIDPRLGIGSCQDEPEYFLAQYRTHDGYDKGLDTFIDSFGFAPGVLIFHVDESVSDNTDDARRLVDVEEANDVDLSDFAPQEGNFWVDGIDDTFDPASSPSSAYNDGARSDVSMVVGAQTTALPFSPVSLVGGATPLPLGKTVSVTIRCQIPWGGPIGGVQLP